MTSVVVKQTQHIYEDMLEEFREESFSHLEDHEIDNIDKNCDEFLKDERTTKKIVRKVIRFDLYLVIALLVGSFVFLYISFAPFAPIFQYFWYFMIGAAFVVLFWFAYLSPLRSHHIYNEKGKRDNGMYIKYRGVLTPGTSILRQLQDNKWRYLTFGYFLTAMMCILMIFEDINFTSYMNYIMGANPNISGDPIPSINPALIVILMFSNILGIYGISKIKSENGVTKESVKELPNKKIIFLVVAGVIYTFTMLMLFYNISNFAQVFDPTIPHSFMPFNYTPFWNPLYTLPAGLFTLLVYTLIVLGCVAIALFLVFGISALEGGYIKMLYRQAREAIPPEENNWEYKKVVKRHAKEKKCFNKTRVYSAIELIVIITWIVFGYWTLWYADVVLNNDVLYIIMIAWLAVGVLWVFVFSGYVHYNREKAFYFKDPHQNALTLHLEERGIGSWKTFWREHWKTKKKVIAFFVYFNLIGLIGLISPYIDENFFGKTILQPLGVSANIAYATCLIVYVALNIGFLAYAAQLKIYEGTLEGKFYKLLLLGVIMAFTYGAIPIASAHSTQLAAINWSSNEFILGLAITIIFIALLALLLIFIISPFAMNLDNFSEVKKDMLMIVVSTIILMLLLNAIFDVFLPMVSGDGIEFGWQYPFQSGAKNDPSYLAENFNIGEYLIGWYGYIWWGALQQYLFMSYFLRLLTKIFPNSKGYVPAVFSSCIFGIIHFPDWPLMVFTGLAGLMWAYNWQKVHVTKDGKVVRGNNLWLWGLAHGFGGTFVNLLIPISMSVGPFAVS